MCAQPSCNVHSAVNLIGSKWTLLILHQLCTQQRGFNELLRGIEGINPRALSIRLKEMVESGLLTKTTGRQIEYALTPQGASLKGIIEELGEWASTLPE